MRKGTGTMETIRENLKRIHENIQRAAERVGRDPAEVNLVVVTKNRPVEQIRELLDCGYRVLGENRLQEAIPKMEVLPNAIEWHFVGHLQTNKARPVAQRFQLIHSVDRLRLAHALQRASEKFDIPEIPVLIQVNTSGEGTKFGCPPEETLELFYQLEQCPALKVQGLMTMAPLDEDPEEARASFRLLKELSEQIKEKDFPEVEMKYLSMGMSNDYMVAIEEGANLLRLGTAVFTR